MVGSHIRHHPSAMPTSGGGAKSPGHAQKGGAEPIDQDLLKKYIIYSKEKVGVGQEKNFELNFTFQFCHLQQNLHFSKCIYFQ